MNNQSTANQLDTSSPALTNTQAPFAPVAQPSIPLNQTAGDLNTPITDFPLPPEQATSLPDNQLNQPLANSVPASPLPVTDNLVATQPLSTGGLPTINSNLPANQSQPTNETSADIGVVASTPTSDNEITNQPSSNYNFPQPPQPVKKELPMVAIIGLIVILIIVLGCIIVFTVMQDSRNQSPLEVSLPDNYENELEAVVPTTNPPKISSLSAVSTDAYAQSLEINCVPHPDGGETIAWAELPFSLSQEVKQHFNLMLADSVPCFGRPTSSGMPMPMTRYVMLTNKNNPNELDRFYFTHAHSFQSEPPIHPSYNVFTAFSDLPACNEQNLCYRSPEDQIEFYLNSENDNQFSPQKLCILISNAGQWSADNTLLAKAYVGECFNPETDFEAIYQVYQKHGTTNNNTTAWQLKKPEKISEFYRDLTTIYKGSMRYQNLLKRLHTLSSGVSFN